MARICELCGKRTTSGRSIKRKGKAKYLGGIGKHITGITKRTFKPNIQRIRAEVDGTVKRVKACTKCIRSGLVRKPTPRRLTKQASAKA